MPNKSKPGPADEIHAALSSFSRNTTRATRICQEIADRQRALEVAEDAITAAVLILTPLLERQPKDAAFRYLDTVYWLDPTEGICHRSLREWTDLLHQDDDEPDETRQPYDLTTPPVIVPEPTNDLAALALAAHATANGLTIERNTDGTPYLVAHGEHGKPLSFGEQQARQRYEPLTELQIDEGAFYEARLAEPKMSDAQIMAAAAAFDVDDIGGDEAIPTLWGNVLSNGRGA